MKFPSVDYVRPTSVDEALHALESEDSRVLAGGQSLMPLMAFRLARPERLVDVSRLDELCGVDFDEKAGRLRVGAAVTHRALATNPVARGAAPFLAMTAAHIGHQAIRSRGTIGGSIAHADPAAEWPALAVALDCVLELRSASSAREVPARDFILGPYMTRIEPGEMLTAVVFDLRDDPAVAIEEAARRPGDFALAGAFCVVPRTSTREATVTATVFGVAPRPASREFAKPADDQSLTQLLDDATAWIAGLENVMSDVHADEGLRKHLAGVVFRRALTSALEQLKEGRNRAR